MADPAPLRKSLGDEFFANYYRSPAPDQAPAALADCIQAGMFHDPANVVWYLFVRIARDNPGLIRHYEEAFRSSSDGGLVRLRILKEAGDENTKLFLRSCLTDEKFAPLRDEIVAALENWSPGALQPLSRPISSGGDMDLHWCEFLATGNTEAVLRIIDVLSRPDRIRMQLEEWLRSGSDDRPGFLEGLRRKRIVQKLRKGVGIICDLERGEVVTAQDLDCYCTPL